MVKQLIGSIQMHMKNMLSFFAFFTGFGILGTLIMSIIFWTDDTATSWFCLGTICALGVMSGSIMLLCWKYHQEFMLALSMGQTRREFMITYALRQILWVIAAYILILLMNQLEQLYYRAAFAEKEQAFALSFLMDWRFVVPFIPGMSLLTMFLGSMYSRFGTKFWMILYFVWIGACLFIPRLVNHWDENSGPVHDGIGALAAWIFTIPPVVWTVLVLVAVLIMAVTIIHLGMRQMVR